MIRLNPSLLFVALGLLFPIVSQAYQPDGWTYSSGDYLWSERNQTWVWLGSWDHYAHDFSRDRWINQRNGRVQGWKFYDWPFFWSDSRQAWFFVARPEKEAWVNRSDTNEWSRWGVPGGFRLIPGGDFRMGYNLAQVHSHEHPVHTVEVSAFYLMATEVTNREWTLVRNWGMNNGYPDLPAANTAEPAHPVHSVTWYEAAKWCNAASEFVGLEPVYRDPNQGNAVYRTGQIVPSWKNGADGYRLPTEAEWEKAARGGDDGERFPFGNAIAHSLANYFAEPATVPYDVSRTSGVHPSHSSGTEPHTSPVASFPTNDFRLADMTGNVNEWVWDWFDANYYARSPAKDPRGPNPQTYRILRGGSWRDGPERVRSARRQGTPPGTSSNRFGFRVALTPPN